MIINNNIPALSSYRQMGANQNAASNSMEKLASGLRINKAGDDAAGLAISEKMRAQINGLDQASRNSQDGISMIQTAEGALSETHNILQRMRELATQASNDTNVAVDRNEIQKEMNSLTSEINRIGNTTEFNTQKILKGSADGVETKAALNLDGAGATVFPGGVTSSGATIPATGATVALTAVADTTSSSNAKEMTFNLDGEEIKITVNTGGAADPTVNADGSVTMNIAEGTTQPQMAEALKVALEAGIAANDNIAADAYTIGTATNDLTIVSNGTGAGDFIEVTGDAAVLASGFATGTDVSYTPSEVDVTLTNVANADDLAALVGQGITIGDKTVEFYNADDGVYSGDADFGVNISTALNGVFGDSAANLADAISTQLGDKVEGLNITNAGAVLTFTATADGAKGDGIVIKDGVDVAAVTSNQKFSATFQVGANQGQSMSIDINDMRSMALGISGNDSSAAIQDKDGNVIENAAYTLATDVTDGTNNETTEFALNVSSHESASAAITVINNAIEAVSAERSNLGASQNRLEHTISNLGTSAENLQAAESRVRDTDMAREVMEMTKNNILAQASQAMLAQANQAPQSVLQLLG
jgi:flagellin